MGGGRPVTGEAMRQRSEGRPLTRLWWRPVAGHRPYPPVSGGDGALAALSEPYGSDPPRFKSH